MNEKMRDYYDEEKEKEMERMMENRRYDDMDRGYMNRDYDMRGGRMNRHYDEYDNRLFYPYNPYYGGGLFYREYEDTMRRDSRNGIGRMENREYDEMENRFRKDGFRDQRFNYPRSRR